MDAFEKFVKKLQKAAEREVEFHPSKRSDALIRIARMASEAHSEAEAESDEHKKEKNSDNWGDAFDRDRDE
jgi:hypothetical protein